MGVRFQAQPRESPSEILLHVHLLDANAQHEKEAVGIVGVNLLYAAFYQRASPESLIRSLMHDLSRQRIEIDMISFSGPAFAGAFVSPMLLPSRSTWHLAAEGWYHQRWRLSHDQSVEEGL
jgi:hypothetical protein